MSMQIDLNAWTYTICSGKTYDTLSNEMFGNLFLEPWRMRVNKNREANEYKFGQIVRVAIRFDIKFELKFKFRTHLNREKKSMEINWEKIKEVERNARNWNEIGEKK